MTEHSTQFEPEYKSLDDIRLRKAQLHADLIKDGNKIAGLWNELMYKPKDTNKSAQRFSGVINTGVGMLDALILGWKLYHKFSGKKSGGILGNYFNFLSKRKNV